MTAELPESLLRYFATREQQRATAVAALLAALTDRERALVKEAAVMGYVLGRIHPQGVAHPKDNAVLADVVDACLVHPDLYPAINAVAAGCGEGAPEPVDPWQAIADALNAAPGGVLGIDLDGTVTDHDEHSVVWDRAAERWVVAPYDEDEAAASATEDGAR